MTTGHPLAAFSPNVQRLYQIAEDKAVAGVSHQVFHFLPPVARKGLVAQEILTVLSGQDDDTSDARVRELLNDLYAANEAVFA
jgi:hypothetical protein